LEPLKERSTEKLSELKAQVKLYIIIFISFWHL
jgi:hypothetical protein